MTQDLGEGKIFFSVIALLALFIAIRMFVPDGIRVPGQPLPQTNRTTTQAPVNTVDPSTTTSQQQAPRATVP